MGHEVPIAGDPRRGPRALARLAAALLLWLVAASGCGKYDGDFDFDSDGSVDSTTESEAPGVDGVAAFTDNVHPLLETHCGECHAGAGPGTPHIAHGDPSTAYRAVVNNQKVNLAAPANSRLVRRLSADFHHCWSDCDGDAAQMEAAIVAWAEAVNFATGTTQSEGAIESVTASLAEGFEDQGDERYDGTLIALWEFKEGSGQTAFDTSGVGQPLHLSLQGEVRWLSSYGIEVREGSARGTRSASKKLYDRIADPSGGTQQYSVEAWVVPASVDLEGPARIASYSDGTGRRNFTLGQVLYSYDFRNRSLAAEIDSNGTPSLQTYDVDRDLQPTLQHTVMTYDQFRGRRIYVNGRWTDDVDEQGPGRLWNWDDNQIFILGNETSDNRPWLGQLRLVAVYDHALTEEQILQNFNAGVGKRLVLRFDVSDWTGSGGYIEFVVSELDDYSYLFCEPTLVTPNPNGVRVANLRILVNGQIAVSGQAFNTIDAIVTQTRQRLSNQCSVISKDQGATLDQFAVDFEYLGRWENPIVFEIPEVPPDDSIADPLPVEGLRDFARINDTMASLTGVDPNDPEVADTFFELQQQLPPGYDLRAFSSSQQVGIAKLALEYCDALVETPGVRQAFFGPDFDFDAAVPTAFADQTRRNWIIDPLVDGMVGISLASQPGPAELQPVLDGLIDELTAGCDATTCGPDRTRAVVKASCAAVLSSAAISVH